MILSPFVRLGERALDLLYPPRCPVCHEPVGEAGARICAACSEVPAYIRDPYCLLCGAQLSDRGRERCTVCEGRETYFLRNFPLMSYDQTARESVAQFKFHGRREYALWYAQAWTETWGDAVLSRGAAFVTSVPAHPKKKRERGYDQAEVFARETARLLHLPYAPHLLVRRGSSAQQKTLGRAARRENLRSAFAAGPGRMPEGTALLLDDVYTTGETLDACSRILAERGAPQILTGTVCVGQDGGGI
ncbi:MAG: ComF family protein [Lachnospiraceae bacterium]|nr:ComF family protein [Lachnospiraceae bacterium]